MDRISDISSEVKVEDQMGREVRLVGTPQRIISLVPSITEYLVDLGLGQKLVGRTRFCTRPHEGLQHVEIIGGTKNFDVEKIRSLRPDLIIGNREENYKEGINELAEFSPVWMSDIVDLDHNYEMMEALGLLTGKAHEASLWIQRVRENFRKYYKRYSGRVLYLIWRKPYMAAGRDTFINHIINYLGFENAVLQKRYPEIDPYILEQLNPDQVFLSSEPFPFKPKHIEELKSFHPKAITRLVDGEAFSWYGSRLAKVSFDF